MVPHGDRHVMGNGAGVAAVNDSEELGDVIAQGMNLWRMGGGGEVTKFVCGYMACDLDLSRAFLSGLPPLFKISIRHDAAGQWLENSIRFSVNEAGAVRPGGEAVLARLAEVLFVETLRGYIASLPAEQTGWLAGARDGATKRGPAGAALVALYRPAAGLGRRGVTIDPGPTNQATICTRR